jgi:RNA polymerase sigma factor (sigma-70 family)
MNSGTLRSALSGLFQAIDARLASGLAEHSDGQLLGDFLARHDVPAFEALLRRHGPMVLGVCRRLLQRSCDVEDAFQGTFLVLLGKGASIRKHGSLASWLYGVALRTAARARASAAQRREQERQAVPVQPTNPRDEHESHELRALLDEEIASLPETHRTALVLCALEGKSIQEAARQLGWPPGTVAGRLGRARAELRQRLLRRGITVPVGALAAALSPLLAPPALAEQLLGATVAVGAGYLAGNTTVLSSAAAALAREVLQSLASVKSRLTALLLTAGLALATGLPGSPAPRVAVPAPLPVLARKPADPAAAREKHRPQGRAVRAVARQEPPPVRLERGELRLPAVFFVAVITVISAEVHVSSAVGPADPDLLGSPQVLFVGEVRTLLPRQAVPATR